MAKEGGKINARSSRGEGQGLKKGQWSNAEDQVLMEYVQINGEGNWSSVPKKSGLKRCGKSCRLRWANHLKPDLKKCPISSQEEHKIIELHAEHGNKWACIAANLKGRTDNEIKNFWNTRAKKRNRAGLPLYPLYIRQRQGPNSLSSLLQNPNFSHSQPTVFNSFTFTSLNAPPYSSGNSHFNLMGNTNRGGMALSLSSSSNQPFSASSSISPMPPYYNQALPLTSFNMNGLRSTMGASFNGFTYSQTELPSIQFPFDQAITQASSSTITNQSEYLFPTSRTDVDNYGIAPQLYSRGNVGFLGDVLRDSQALLISEKGKGKDILDWGQMEEDHNTVDFEEIFKVTDRNMSSENNLEDSSRGISSFEKGKGKEILDWELMEDPTAVDVESIFMAADGNTSHVNNLEGPSTGHSSFEIDDFVERNPLTADDISSLLDNFPISGKSFENVTDANVGPTLDNTREVLWSPVVTALTVAEQNEELNQGTCWWNNNIPGFWS